MRTQILAFTAIFALMTAGVWGQYQSLADVARAEEARRKTVKAPGKVYTNDDLKRAGVETRSPAPVAVAPASATQPVPAAKPEAADTQKPGAGQKDEKYWRDRITTLQQTLTRNQVLLDALQTRLNALDTDFVNRDDPGQRSVIDTNRQTARAEMQRLSLETEKAAREIVSVQEEARKAGVPAGWLR